MHGSHFKWNLLKLKSKKKFYHDLGAAAVQGDACQQVCGVVVDPTRRAVELQLIGVDVVEGGDRKHQNHLCLVTRQHCTRRQQRTFRIDKKPCKPFKVYLILPVPAGSVAISPVESQPG